MQDLGHIDATLRIVASDMAVEAIRPKAFRPPADWSKRGEMTRMVLAIGEIKDWSKGQVRIASTLSPSRINGGDIAA